MTTVKAIDFDDNEITIEDVQEISEDFGNIEHTYDLCAVHPFFGLQQCPDCRSVKDKTCGKWFVAYSNRIEPGPIEVDGRPVKEIIEIV